MGQEWELTLYIPTKLSQFRSTSFEGPIYRSSGLKTFGFRGPRTSVGMGERGAETQHVDNVLTGLIANPIDKPTVMPKRIQSNLLMAEWNSDCLRNLGSSFRVPTASYLEPERKREAMILAVYARELSKKRQSSQLAHTLWIPESGKRQKPMTVMLHF